MHRMKVTKAITILFILSFINPAISQKTYNTVFEINTMIGFSNDFASNGEYDSFILNEMVAAEKKTSILVRSIGFSFSRYLSKWGGIRLSIGQQKFGFGLKGKGIGSNIPVTDFFRVTYIGLSAEILYRTQITTNAKLLINAGIHYNSDPDRSSQTIVLRTGNAYSGSLYTGFEYPMFGHNLFVNAGLQILIPLKRYDSIFISEAEYLPYSFGLKLGINYQF